MLRSLLHIIDNQISISNNKHYLVYRRPGTSFPSERKNIRYYLGYPQELGFLGPGNKEFVYLDVRQNQGSKAKKYSLGRRLWTWQK
jgi:hypothetical protein